MIIDFQQGIITYPSSGAIQRFLAYDSGYVNLTTTDGRVDVTFAHGAENYLHTEASSVTHAWGPIEQLSDAWLYFDINPLTAVRTFGVTYFQPAYGATPPDAPQGDQHWFDTVNRKMMVYRSGKWLNKIRVFAAKINNNVFSPLGINPTKPFAGSQVGIAVPGITAGRIIVDVSGNPIRRQDGLLFTTEDEFFVNGSPVNTIRLEANVLNGTAKENIARYQVVKFSEFGKINLAAYDDVQNTAIAMSMEDIMQGQAGTLCMQGVVTNPEWNWQTVGAPLWAHGSIPGLLVEYDPHVESAALYQTGKPPVARVLTPTAIFFDQGLGGKGEKGEQGSANVPLATNTIFGISKLSVAAASATNPIVVGDNDPRNFNDRYPLAHNQAASTITTIPVGIINGATVQDNLQIINDGFVKRAGDSMTGYLTLSADPANDLHAASKHYVDTRALDNLADVTITSPVAENVLKYDGTGWINGPGTAAQLWMAGSRSVPTAWVPAVAIAEIGICSEVEGPFATADDLLQYNVNSLMQNTDIPTSAQMIDITINGTLHEIDLGDATKLSDVRDVVAAMNSDPVLSSLVTVSIGPMQGTVGLLVVAKSPSDTIEDFVCGPIEYAADMTSDDMCSWEYQFGTVDGKSAALTVVSTCDSTTYTDPVALASAVLTFASYTSTFIVDGVAYHVAISNTDIDDIGTIGDIIDIHNARMMAYAQMEASGDIDGVSGIVVTSNQNTVSTIEIDISSVLDDINGLCPIVYPPSTQGNPVSTVLLDPILTPSPHAPVFKETYVPMHTVIDSDTPVVNVPYWLDAIGDTNSSWNTTTPSYGQIAVGIPGRSNPSVRQTDTVYVVGTYQTGSTDTSGILIEVRDPNSGQLITTNGYAGRVVLPLGMYNTTVYDTLGVGIGVGNAAGGVYALAGINGRYGYADDINYAAVICLDPKLTTVTWIRYIDLGIIGAPNTTWIGNTRGGFCVNKTTNVSYAALQIITEVPAPDMYTPAVRDTGVAVVAFDPVGNTIWTKCIYARHDSAADWVPTLPPALAVHESTGDVYVAYAERVAKLAYATGDILWCTDIDGANAFDNGLAAHAITVDQATGDAYISAFQTTTPQA